MVSKENYPQIPKINWLYLHNFKSFKGDHKIGPFLNLTAIIGPNGGGKSNLLDAICFVFLIRTTQARETNLKQFINKASGEQSNGKAWVEIEFSNKNNKIISFKRAILAKGGHSVYYVDGDTVSREKYLEELENQEIVKRTRSYCAIMQGEIDSILQNSSKEIVKIVEELSGSSKYKAQYEELRAKMEQTQNQISAVSKTIQELRKEKRKAKGLKTNIEAFEKCREHLAQFQREFYVTTCALYEIKAKELKQTASEIQDKIKAQSEIKEKDLETLDNLHKEMSDLFKESSNIDREKERLKMSRGNCEKTIKSLEAKIDGFQKERGVKESVLVSLENSSLENAKKINELEAEKTSLNEEYKKIMKEIEDGDDQSQGKEAKIKQEEYYKIKNNIQAKTFDMQSELRRLKRYSEGYTQRINSINEMIQKLNSQLSDLYKEKEEINIEKTEQEILLKKDEQKELSEKYNEIIEKQRDQFNKISELELQLTVGEYEMKRLEQEHEFKLQRGREYHMIEQLKTKVRGCRGLLIQLISACEKKYDVAVKFGMGKYLTHLVVDDESSAASCNIFLKDAGVMKDILILGNIPKTAYLMPSTSLISPEECAPGSVRLVDAIEYNANIKRLKETIMFIAGKKIICNDMQAAKKLRLNGYKEIITLNGEIVKQGAIAGGSNEALLGLELQHADHAAKVEEVKKGIEQIKGELENLRKNPLAASIIDNKHKLETLSTQITGLEELLINHKQKLEIILDNEKEIKKKLENAEKEKNEVSQNLSSIYKEIEDLQKSISELEEKPFEEFCAKWKISNIKEYEGTDLAHINTLLSQKTELINRIEQCNAQIELLEASQMKEKIGKLQSEIDILKEKLIENLENLKNEKQKSEEINEKYNSLDAQISQIEEKKQNLVKNQDFTSQEILRSNDAIDELKKEYITCLCQAKSNIHMKIRTVDEAKLKNIEISFEVIKNPKEMATQGLDYDYKIDYNKYDIDPLIATSKDLDEKVTNLQECIAEEEKKLNEFNTLALLKEEGEELGDLDKEIENHRKDLDKFSKEHETNEKEYKKIRESRKNAFKSCYDLLSTYVDGIYQELTKTEETGFTYGGHAILVPENVGEPYNGEIQYVPTPPGKRVVYELDQLSGGEKALAALALVLAIQKYQQAPILILDEVDAHLDIRNVSRLASVLSNNGETGFQCIMVSHKEALASMFHGVIGVTTSKSMVSSKALSIDLRDK